MDSDLQAVNVTAKTVPYIGMRCDRRARRLTFHKGTQPPRVTRYVAQSMSG